METMAYYSSAKKTSETVVTCSCSGKILKEEVSSLKRKVRRTEALVTELATLRAAGDSQEEEVEVLIGGRGSVDWWNSSPIAPDLLWRRMAITGNTINTISPSAPSIMPWHSRFSCCK
jgi:hypothetical protein